MWSGFFNREIDFRFKLGYIVRKPALIAHFRLEIGGDPRALWRKDNLLRLVKDWMLVTLEDWFASVALTSCRGFLRFTKYIPVLLQWSAFIIEFLFLYIMVLYLLAIATQLSLQSFPREIKIIFLLLLQTYAILHDGFICGRFCSSPWEFGSMQLLFERKIGLESAMVCILSNGKLDVAKWSEAAESRKAT